jgi:hypothetical protein
MTTEIDAGSYSPDSYAAWQIGPDSPLLPIAGGTGVSINVPTLFQPTTATLTVTAGAGVSTPTVTGPTLISGQTSVGSVVSVNTTVSFTATASTATFNIGIPSSIAIHNFTNGSQANGVANIVSGTGGGTLSALASVSSSRNISVTLALGGSSGTYVVNLAFAFFVN